MSAWKHRHSDDRVNVGLLGHGYVGQAVAHSHAGDRVVIRDPILGSGSATMSAIAETDCIYVCLPSPSTRDGSCDSSFLENELETLMAQTGMDQKIVICKTTALPTVYARLHDRWPNIVHVPEFLTAHNHVSSYMSSSYFVLGGSADWCLRAQDVLQARMPLARDRYVITDIRTAALYKYMMNSYLATKVTFMNEFYDLARALAVDFQDLVTLAGLDPRLGRSHMLVPGPDGRRGWGGACLPKDVSAVIRLAQEHDLGFELMCSVSNINKQHRIQ